MIIRARVHTRYMRPSKQHCLRPKKWEGKERKRKGRGKGWHHACGKRVTKARSRIEKRLPCVKSSRRRVERGHDLARHQGGGGIIVSLFWKSRDSRVPRDTHDANHPDGWMSIGNTTKRWLQLPFIYDGGVLGTITLFSSKPMDFFVADLCVLSTPVCMQLLTYLGKLRFECRCFKVVPID